MSIVQNTQKEPCIFYKTLKTYVLGGRHNRTSGFEPAAPWLMLTPVGEMFWCNLPGGLWQTFTRRRTLYDLSLSSVYTIAY